MGADLSRSQESTEVVYDMNANAVGAPSDCSIFSNAYPQAKNHVVTRLRTTTRPMLSSLAG
jgi:hypothetical protein